jgi:hypothetical protein
VSSELAHRALYSHGMQGPEQPPVLTQDVGAEQMPAVDGGSETNLLGGWPCLGDGGEQINRLDFPVRRGGAPVVGVSVVEGHRGGAGQWAGSATVAGRRSVGWLWGAGPVLVGIGGEEGRADGGRAARWWWWAVRGGAVGGGSVV